VKGRRQRPRSATSDPRIECRAHGPASILAIHAAQGRPAPDPSGRAAEVTVRIAPALLTSAILGISAAASDLGGACLSSGLHHSDGSRSFRCTVSEALEWTCDGEPVARGSSLERALTSSCWPCAERFARPDLPCERLSVVQFLDDARSRSIEYCVKPGCLDLIAPEAADVGN